MEQKFCVLNVNELIDQIVDLKIKNKQLMNEKINKKANAQNEIESEALKVVRHLFKENELGVRFTEFDLRHTYFKKLFNLILKEIDE